MRALGLGGEPGSRLETIAPGLPLLLGGYWALSGVLDWYGRRFLQRLPFGASLAIIGSAAVGLNALLAWLMLFAPAVLWEGIWLVLLPSGFGLLAFLISFRLAAVRARLPLRLDRGGIAPVDPDVSCHRRLEIMARIAAFCPLEALTRGWPPRWTLRAG